MFLVIADRAIITHFIHVSFFSEGVAHLDSDANEIDGADEQVPNGEVSNFHRPKLQNNIAGMCMHVVLLFDFTVHLKFIFAPFSGLITRFLPAIEAFFMVNSSSSEDSDDNHRIVHFAASNKILL